MNEKSRGNLCKIVIVAMMIALEIVLHRFLAYSTAVVQIHLGFLPIAAVAMLYGPIWSGVAWAIADFIGITLFPTGGGGFFPGFTLSLFLCGVVFGLFLYGGKRSFWSVLAAVLINAVCFSLLLDTFWLKVYWGYGFLAMLPTRLIKVAVMVPIQLLLIPILQRLMRRAKLIA